MTDLFEKCRNYTRHKEAERAGLYPYFKPINSGAGPEVVIDSKKMVMIGSNNYLGLTQDPRVKQAAKDAIDKYGSGCTGSRFLNGTLDIHIELEERLARFLGKEKALVFSTGFQTNLGIISSLVSKDDVVVCDRMNHASIIDGCRLSFGEMIKYKHNDMQDLERVLSNIQSHSILVVVDGVFSMEGDLVNLPAITSLNQKYDAKLLVDDAHAIGVMGENGRGTAEHFGVEDKVDLVMGTFSKSFASLGGFVAGEEEVIDYIKHHARSLIFSASMPPPCVAAVLKCLDIIETEPERRETLRANAKRMHEGFKQMGFNIGQSQTPVIPVILGELDFVLIFWKQLFDRGIYVNPIVAPAVPDNMCLLRTSYMSTHTEQMLTRVLDVFYEVGRLLKAI